MTDAPPDPYPTLGAVLAALTWEGDPKMTDFWNVSVAPYPPGSKITRVVILEESYAMTCNRIEGVRTPLRSVAPQRWNTTGRGALEVLVARGLWPWEVEGDEAPLWYCETCDDRPEDPRKPECVCQRPGVGLEHVKPHDVATLGGRGRDGLLFIQEMVKALAPKRRMILRVRHELTLWAIVRENFRSIPRDLRSVSAAAFAPESFVGSLRNPPWWWILVAPELQAAWPHVLALAAREVLVQEHGSSGVLVTVPPLGDRPSAPVWAAPP